MKSGRRRLRPSTSRAASSKPKQSLYLPSSPTRLGWLQAVREGGMEAVKVFLCGGKASGKTVYLSALYKSLSVPNKQIGLRCETSASARNRLSRIYNRLRQSWPSGNELDDQFEIPFSFFIDTVSDEGYLGSEVCFYDIAGESISNAHDNRTIAARMEQVKELADGCDVVISVIDGLHVYQSLNENGGQPTPELLDSIDAALSFWQSSGKERSKLRQNNYFLITKWDIFEDSNESVEKVYDILFGIDDVDNYIDRLDEDSIVRIIPVSAVGTNFAALNPETGEMEIVAKKPGEPVNVHVPIACLVPDLIDAELARLREETDREVAAEQRREVPFWKRLLAQAGAIIERSDTIRRIVNDLGVKPADIDRLATLLQHPAIRTEEERQQKLAELASKVKSQDEASAVIHRYFSDIKDAFDSRYPSSLVRG